MVDVPDMGSFFQTVLNWVFYPWTHWSFGFLGLFHIPMYYYLVGCALFGLALFFISWLAGNSSAKLRLFNILFGGMKK